MKLIYSDLGLYDTYHKTIIYVGLVYTHYNQLKLILK